MRQTSPAILFFWLLSLSSIAQMRNFTVFPYQVSVVSTVTSSVLTGFSTVSPPTYVAGNAAYQENGSNTPYFTIRDFEVFDASGDLVGNLPTYTQYDYCDYPDCIRRFGNLIAEIAVVPVPGSCRRFYVIYSLEAIYATVTMHVIVNADDPNNIYIESVPNNLIYPTSPYASLVTGNLAVTRKKTNGNYDLYVLWGDRIKRFELTSSGIVFDTDLAVGTSGVTYMSGELELSPSETHLAWGHYTNLFILDISTGGITPISLSCSGIEFHSSNDYILFVADGTGSNNIKQVNFSGTISISNISFPSDWYIYTQLEKDANGRIYGGYYTPTNGDYRLFYFEESNTTNQYTTTIKLYGTAGYLMTDVLALNDQIDGADYYNFQSTLPVVLSTSISSEINNTGNWNVFFNCNPLDLDINTTGDEARIIITKLDINKNPILGGGAYAYTTAWSTPSSLSVDLRYLTGTSNHLLTNYGYYSIVVQTRNECSSTDEETWYLQIDAPPSPASITLELNDYATPGVPDAPVQTLPGLAVGIYSGSFNINNSSGDISYYSIAIDEVNSSTGALIRTIYSPSNVNVSNISSLTAFNLNTLNIPAIPAISWAGGTGFFASKGYGNVYKITIEVGNECGGSSNWSYLNSNCFCRFGNESEFISAGKSLNAYPNPFNNEVLLDVIAGENARISIVSSIGNNMYERSLSGYETTNGNIRVDTQSFPKGLYFYKIESAGMNYSGTLIK